MQSTPFFVFFFVLPIFLISFVPLLSNAVEVQFAQATCGSTIPIDSQWIIDPVWSAELLRQRLDVLSTSSGPIQTELIFRHVAVSPDVAALVAAESGMDPHGVVVFAFDPLRRAMPNCSVQWSPLLAGMSGTETTTARVTVLDAIGCNTSTRLEIEINGEVLHSMSAKPSAPGGVDSLTFATADVRWPVELRVTGNCTTHLLLLTARYGSLHPLCAWIPATVYTAVIVSLVLLAFLYHYRVSSGMTIALASLVFLGYMGSCIGLAVELTSWQSAIGRMFPLPDAVTFYICLSILYLILFIPLFARHPQRGFLTRAVLSLAVYGLNCALVCGYWIAGLVFFGIIALVQYFVVNMYLTFAYSYFSVVLDRSGMITEPISNSAGILWFAPLTPFNPCALIYYALFIVENNTRRAPAALEGIVEAVTLYNVITAVPILLLENVWGIALLSAATVYHMPFIVFLFGASIIFSLHVLLALSEYLSARRRWENRGLFAQYGKQRRCWRPLWPAVDQCVRATRAKIIHEEAARMRHIESVLRESSSPPRAPSGLLYGRAEQDESLRHHHPSAAAATAVWSPQEAECFPPSTAVYEGETGVAGSSEYWPPSITT